jgi:hypothetical protein
MNTHSFKVGDIVSFSSNIGQRDDGTYEIVRVMPSDGPEPAYRLKNVAEPRERVAQQHELRVLRGGAATDIDTQTQPKVERRPSPQRRRQ